MTLEELRSHREGIARAVVEHGGRLPVRVFGSVARGDAAENSDIDLLVELEPGRSLLDRVELQSQLEALLGRRVDAVSPNGLYWAVREQILKEAVVL